MDMVFERKTVRGKRLILCPPIAGTNNIRSSSDLPEYEFATIQAEVETEAVNF